MWKVAHAGRKKGSRPNLKSVCTLLQRLATLPLPTTVANIKTYGTNEFQVRQNETKHNETKQTKQNTQKNQQRVTEYNLGKDHQCHELRW